MCGFRDVRPSADRSEARRIGGDEPCLGLALGVAGEQRRALAGAPGSRPVGVLASGIQVRMKVHRCRKCDEGDGLVFTLDGRLLDATRVLRAELGLLLETPESAGSSANEPARTTPSE